MNSRYDCLVIGAGPAGLATSRELSRRGIRHLVLERGPNVAHCWRNAYDSLKLHTGKHLSALPGLRFSRATPLFPTRDDFVRYLADYTEQFRLPVACSVEVAQVRRSQEWIVETATNELQARTLVIATGLMSNPTIPEFTCQELFRGTIAHTITYHRPEPFTGQRVLVVGVGNSGGEVASELARRGVNVTIAVRSGANVVPLTLGGLPIQYLSVLVRKLPRPAQDWIVERIRRRNDQRHPPVLPRPSHSPLDAIPLIGFQLTDAIRAGQITVRPGIDTFTRTGVRFSDGSTANFDAVLLATGFKAALQPLGSLVQTDARGFALRSNRVRSSQYPSLFFVGHNYDAGGGLRNIARDAPLAARAVASLCARE